MIKKYAWVIWISYKCTLWSIFGPLLCLKFANTLFTRICREFEKWCNLRVLSGKFLRQQYFYPESFCFFWLWGPPCLSIFHIFYCDEIMAYSHLAFITTITKFSQFSNLIAKKLLYTQSQILHTVLSRDKYEVWAYSVTSGTHPIIIL